MMPPFEASFVRALGLTLVLELPIVWAAVRKIGKIGPGRVSPRRLVSAALLATGATLPYLWFLGPVFFSMHGYPLLAAEGVISVVEAGIFRLAFSCGWGLCLGTSIAANAFSWYVGGLLRII